MNESLCIPGATTLGLRTKFYPQRFLNLREKGSDEVRRLMDLFGITNIETVLKHRTFIVPVNMTYYPIRARENIFK